MTRFGSVISSPALWLVFAVIAVVVAVLEVAILIYVKTAESLLLSVITTKALLISVLAAQLRIVQQQQVRLHGDKAAGEEQAKFESENAGVKAMLEALTREVERLKADAAKNPRTDRQV